ncbi:hypothetical protein GCM10009727_17000 [Actinomadura napierensis]|uniref:Uncharacterized protein n=1 Tax=Actinomadura napierensis TaxID=267854 RepID=A0ABN2YH40_9ACTN
MAARTSVADPAVQAAVDARHQFVCRTWTPDAAAQKVPPAQNEPDVFAQPWYLRAMNLIAASVGATFVLGVALDRPSPSPALMTIAGAGAWTRVRRSWCGLSRVSGWCGR